MWRRARRAAGRVLAGASFKLGYDAAMANNAREAQKSEAAAAEKAQTTQSVD